MIEARISDRDRHGLAEAPSPPAVIETGAAHVRDQPVYVVKAQMFRTLGHPVRIRILEILIGGERTVGDLQAALDLGSSGTSQHLAALRRQGLVESRRSGTSVYYRTRDARLGALLDLARQILTGTLSESATLLHDLSGEAFAAGGSPARAAAGNGEAQSTGFVEGGGAWPASVPD
jgi:ArsR family transcriptional regulator